MRHHLLRHLFAGIVLLALPTAVFAAATATPVNGTVPVAAAPTGAVPPAMPAAGTSISSAKTAAAGGASAAKTTLVTATQPTGAKHAAASNPGSMLQTLAFFAVPLGIVYLLILMPKSREDKRRKKMLSALKRGDRVVTTGGMLASVIDVRDSEVVLKVDESANVKARFTRSAIAAVLPDETSADVKS